MTQIEMPWLEMGRAETPGSGSDADGTCLALFAARICPKPFEAREKQKWGWSLDTLLEEALDRQRLFIELQHPADDLALEEPQVQRSLSLRCAHDPSRPGLDLALLARVSAPQPQAARSLAGAYWREISSLFPYDYDLQPALTRQDFRRLSGQELLQEAFASIQNGAAADPTLGSPGIAVELHRFQGVLPSQPGPLLLLGKWQPSVRSDEQIWRALAGSPVPVLLSVTLHPSVLLEAERLALSQMAELSRQAAAEHHPLLCRDAEWSAQLYTDRSAGLRYPFLLQVHLAAPASLPGYLPRAVGSALSHPVSKTSTFPGYQVAQPADPGSLARCLDALCWAGRFSMQEDLFDERFARLRDMVDASEALAAFRFPYPSAEGIPGVSFNETEK